MHRFEFDVDADSMFSNPTLNIKVKSLPGEAQVVVGYVCNTGIAFTDAGESDFSCGGQSEQGNPPIRYMRPAATCTARSAEGEVVASISPNCQGSNESGAAYVYLAAFDWQTGADNCREYELTIEVQKAQ